MLVFLAEHVLTDAPFLLFHRAIHSTISMLMFAFLVVLAQAYAP